MKKFLNDQYVLIIKNSVLQYKSTNNFKECKKFDNCMK